MSYNNKQLIRIFDTTLRDGEQSPGASMSLEDKIKIAQQLENLQVDVIEAGFAIASKGDFEAISEISQVITRSTVCSLSRAKEADIKKAADAIQAAKYKSIHTFIATSPIHMKYKLKMKANEVLKQAVQAVQYAKTFTEAVEFSAEDATRSELTFLKEIFAAVIEAGATTINIPDTVGYATPIEYGKLIKELYEALPKHVYLSAHCHNDLGLAVANSLAGIENGIRQVECTVNGIGERAGNTALEEIVMALKVRKDFYQGFNTQINTKELYASSKLLSNACGIYPQPNKAIVGKNAFAHESGIHQDGVLKYRETYEIMNAQDVGFETNQLSLGKLSGRNALRDRLNKLNIKLDEDRFQEVFATFKDLADKKTGIFDDDIYMLAANTMNSKDTYKLESLQFSGSSESTVTATLSIKYKGEVRTDAAVGPGIVDAILKTVDRITNYKGQLLDYKVDAVTEGKDALANAFVKVAFEQGKVVMGKAVDIDTMMASAKAYLDALNKYLRMKDGLKRF